MGLSRQEIALLNLFVPNAPFLYPLKISENLTVSRRFQRVEKGCIGNEWVKYGNCDCKRFFSDLARKVPAC